MKLPGFRLPKKKFLRQHEEFQTVYRRGTSYANRYLVLYVLRSEEFAGKVGFAAGKKLGCAAQRNRIKRILRESYRLMQARIRRDCALILVGRKSLLGEKCETAQKAFADLIRRARIAEENTSPTEGRTHE